MQFSSFSVVRSECRPGAGKVHGEVETEERGRGEEEEGARGSDATWNKGDLDGMMGADRVLFAFL